MAEQHPDLDRVLADWTSWSDPSDTTVKRTLADHCILSEKVVTVVQGVRHCGKSTLLTQLQQIHKIPSQAAVHINFEDPRLAGYLTTALLDQIYTRATEQYSEPLTFFLDEIQNVSLWQKWINTRLSSNESHRYVVTGSNSKLLSGELASTLTGRHLSHELFPFNFTEYQAVTNSRDLFGLIDSGGFPATFNFPKPQQLLQQYFVDIIDKDVRERVAARSSRSIQAVVKMVFESLGSEISLRRIAGSVQLSPETVNHYLQACEDAYLIFSCPFFAYSEKQRQRHNRKYYAIDTGLRRSVITQRTADYGKDFENLVYLSLRSKTKDISYWRDKGEVDFVVQTNSGITPIQVTVGEPQARHQDALAEFYRKFPHANEALFITPDSFEQIDQVL